MTFRRIDKETPVPLHYQISQQIRQRMEAGELKHGDYLPTERELQEQFGVSRATIRRAISDLVYAGLLERRRAKGTTVSRAKIEETLSGFGSFTNEILKRNMTPKSRVLDFRFLPADASVAEHLQIPPGESVAVLDRLREVDDEPVAVETWYTPLRIVPGLERSDFAEEGREQSTYFLLEHRFGLRLYRAEDSMEAVALEAKDARLLGMEKGCPVLLRTRVAYTTDDLPVVFSHGVYVIKILLSLNSKRPPFGAAP